MTQPHALTREQRRVVQSVGRRAVDDIISATPTTLLNAPMRVGADGEHVTTLKEAIRWHKLVADEAKCPMCHVPKGEPCRGNPDYYWVHPDRLLQAEAQMRLSGRWEAPSWWSE